MAGKPKNQKKNPKGKALEKKITKNVMSKIGQEVKYHDSGIAGTGSIDFNGTVADLSDLALGTTQGQLTGVQIHAKWLYLGFSVQFATVANTVIRFLVVQDRSGGTTAPTPATILPSVGNVFSVLQPTSAFNTSRFAILYDYSTYGDASRITTTHKRYMKVKIKNIYYGASGAPNRNNIYLLMISTNSANLPAVQWYSRLAYTDS